MAGWATINGKKENPSFTGKLKKLRYQVSTPIHHSVVLDPREMASMSSSSNDTAKSMLRMFFYTMIKRLHVLRRCGFASVVCCRKAVSVDIIAGGWADKVDGEGICISWSIRIVHSAKYYWWNGWYRMDRGINIPLAFSMEISFNEESSTSSRVGSDTRWGGWWCKVWRFFISCHHASCEELVWYRMDNEISIPLGFSV